MVASTASGAPPRDLLILVVVAWPLTNHPPHKANQALLPIHQHHLIFILKAWHTTHCKLPKTEVQAQTLQLNLIYLEVHGWKYSDEVRQSLLSIHRQGNFVNKCSVYQLLVYNIGTSLSSSSTQIQQILLSFQGQASSILFWIRPSTLGGSTDYSLAQLEENVELAQIISLTNDEGYNTTSQNMPARISSEIFVNEFYPGSFLSNLIYLLLFSLQPRQSTHDGSDISYLTMNGNNVLTLQTLAAAANGPYSLDVIVRTQAFLTKDQQGNCTLSYQ